MQLLYQTICLAEVEITLCSSVSLQQLQFCDLKASGVIDRMNRRREEAAEDGMELKDNMEVERLEGQERLVAACVYL
jgi:hypothetical protein